jgi:hypothetical protein
MMISYSYNKFGKDEQSDMRRAESANGSNKPVSYFDIYFSIESPAERADINDVASFSPMNCLFGVAFLKKIM